MTSKTIHKERDAEQNTLLEQIRQTEAQLKAAAVFFSEAKSAIEVDQAIYQIKALEIQHSRLVATAKTQGYNGYITITG